METQENAGAAYVASKHGLLGMTKNIAATHGVHGKIRANAIAQIDQSEEIAEVALFLASDASSFVNGAVITADGG